MANSIKYSTTGDTLSLKEGNIFFGVGDVGKGPSSATTYYNGVTPPDSGYTIYSYNVNQTSRLSFFTAVNDESLVTYTNQISGQKFTTATECLNWYPTQTDFTCVNIDYESIVTSGLTLCLDTGFRPSYSTSGVTWYDISYGGNNGTLTNEPTFDSSNGGIILFDGVNEYVNWNNNPISALTTSITYDAWIKFSVAVQNAFTLSSSNFKVYHQNNSTWYISGTGTGDRNIGWTYITDWINFVYSFDGTNHICYINGVSYTVNSGGGLGTQSNLQLCGRNSGDLPLKGNMAITRVYNRALSALEILKNYNAQKSRYIPLDTDAQAFITAAGITNSTQKNAINQLVLDLKSYSLWTKFSVIYPLVGGTATSHKYNLKDPRDLDVAYRLTFFGGWTHNSNGITGNGTNGYANTFAKMNTAAIPDRLNHYSSYSRTVPSGGLRHIMGILDFNSPFKMFGYGQEQSINFVPALQSYSSLGFGFNGAGFFNGTVTSNSVGSFYRNGTFVQNQTPISMTTQSDFYIGAVNVVGSSPYDYNNTNFAFISLGGALTATDAANFYTAVQAFQTTLGRQV